VNKLDMLTRRYIKATSEWCAANRKYAESTDSTPDTTIRHRRRRFLRAQQARLSTATEIADAVARDFAARMNGGGA
jgi:hypothetical protein